MKVIVFICKSLNIHENDVSMALQFHEHIHHSIVYTRTKSSQLGCGLCEGKLQVVLHWQTPSTAFSNNACTHIVTETIINKSLDCGEVSL